MRNRVVIFDSERQAILRKRQLYWISQKVSSFFWEPSPERPDFESREGQQDMAFEIMDAIIAGRHILVEAGVGIGKSYAYLVPLLLCNAVLRKPVVVATSTIALQEQLLGDVKYLQAQLGLQQEVVLAKGQTHYLCRKRAESYLKRPDAVYADELRFLIAKGFQDRTDFPGDVPQSLWKSINIVRFSRRGCESCPYPCQYRQIRENLMRTSGVILCNQDFLTSHFLQLDRGQKGLINSTVELAVIDEAHNLEAKVRSATTERIGQNSLLGLLHATQNSLKAEYRAEVQGQVDLTQKIARKFFRHLQGQVERKISGSAQNMKYADRFFFDADTTTLSLLRKLADEVADLSRDIQILTTYDRRRDDKFSALDDFEAAAVALQELMDDIEKNLLWIEGRGNHAELVYCPKNTKEVISRLYFRQGIRMILTSATLTEAAQDSLEKAYSYFIRSTGFPFDKDGILAEPKPSPFPYDAHSMIYYCDDLPHPTKEHEAFVRQGVERLIEILDISQGKALVLFTAKTDLEEAFAILQKKKLPYKILIQQPGASQDQVLKEFREDENSVLLGTGAYWEGIDVRGKSLSNLVIFRLPFPVPDPIIEYKASLAKNQLMEVRVPEMIIKLKQGIGRLIRGFSDTGIVSIIDPRLRDKPATPYRDITWASLPIHNRTTSLNELREFYYALDSVHERVPPM